MRACRCPLPCVRGVAAEQDRGNRIFVLVGPPAEELRPRDK
jgi:hypothetical protein